MAEQEHSEKKSRLSRKRLIIGIVALVFGVGCLVVGFLNRDRHFQLNESDYGNTGFVDIDGAKYEEMIKNKESFMVFVDMTGCITADGLRERTKKFSEEHNVRFYRIMWPEAKEVSIRDFLKYYPSVILINKGTVASYLRTDSDEDSDRYNSYEALSEWILKYIKF